MSIEEVQLTSSFEAINEKGEEVSAEAPRDMQWAFVHLGVENPSNNTQFVPSGDDLELLVSKQQVPEVELVEVGKYDPYVNPTQQEGYYSGPSERLPGVVETGWILFAVPEDVSTAAIDVVVY